MGDRDRDRRRGKDDQKSSSSSKESGRRTTTFFVDGAGIDREVITTDICRYLGNDALVKPGEYTNQKTGQTQQGFFITAYRPLTSAQLQDIKSDSAKWQEEKRRNRGPSAAASYDNSATRQGVWSEERQSPSYQPSYTPNTQGYGPPIPAQAQPPRTGYETYTPSSMQPPSGYNRPTQQQPYNNPPQYPSSYVTDNSPPPLAVANYEPRSIQPQYPGQPSPVPMSQPQTYTTGGGQTQYYPSTTVQSRPAMPQPYGETFRDNQYGRAPGAVTEPSEFDSYQGQEDEDMMYEETPAASVSSGGTRTNEGSQKRRHDPHQHRHRQ